MYPNLLGQKAFHRMTEEDMAAVIGVSRITYQQKMKSGRFTPEECKAYCDYFKKSFAFLFATNEELACS